jgi:hypothetical protein
VTFVPGLTPWAIHGRPIGASKTRFRIATELHSVGMPPRRRLNPKKRIKLGHYPSPDSVYTWINPKTGRALQNAIYDENGDVISHVDFKNHGEPSGHGHTFSNPGDPATGHGPQCEHIPNHQLPVGWDVLPRGVLPHTPIGA